MLNKTKIICTIGPSSRTKEIMMNMIAKGMNVVRINMSHSDYSFCDEVISLVNEINQEQNISIGIMLDTKGPEIRTCKFEGGRALLETGNFVKIVQEEILGNSQVFSVTYPDLCNCLNIGQKILLDDGSLELKVVDIENRIIICEVIRGGIIHDTKSVNVPGANLTMPFLSRRDREDIKFAASRDIDFLALSFVHSKEDVLEINDLLIDLGNDHINIISKIENEDAINNIDEIINFSDGVMVARGDLGVELSFEKVPVFQKMILKKCRDANKIGIVATEMLASMEHSKSPTRAEVSDIANAIYDGTDAIMLSGETTIGEYPVETVEVMAKIAISSEENVPSFEESNQEEDITAVIASSVVEAANKLGAKAIVATTRSGYTAMRISKYRPRSYIIAPTPNKKTAKILTLSYGVLPIVVKEFGSTDEILENAISTSKEVLSLVKRDIVVITGSIPAGKTSHTNFSHISEIE